jgi:hypothetical protein
MGGAKVRNASGAWIEKFPHHSDGRGRHFPVRSESNIWLKEFCSRLPRID